MSAIEFLNSCVTSYIEFPSCARSKASWKMNPKTGLIDVKGNVDCSEMELTDFKGVRFGNVEGYFNCSRNKLTSLEGAPQNVRNSFDCSRNQIESLVGAPLVVKGHFNCSYNKLTSLEGSPQEVKNFDCSYNQIETLVGGPKIVWDFSCKGNKLIDLEGAPITRLDRWGEAEVDYYANKGTVRGKVLKLIHTKMIEHKVPYVIAFGMVKGQIDKKVFKKIQSELVLSEDVIKGASMMGKFLNP